MSDTGVNVAFTGPPAGATPLPVNATQAQIDQYIQQNYGYMSWALSVPELRAIIERAVGPNGLTMDQDQINGAIRGTQWFQNATQATRQFQQLQGEDPATAAAQIQKQQAAIQKEAGLVGVTLNPKDLHDMATQAIGFGWSTDEMDAALQAEALKQTFAGTASGAGNPLNPTNSGLAYSGALKQVTGDPFSGGTMGYYYDQVMKLAATYLVTVDPTTASKMAIGLATNQMNPASVEGTMQHLAVGKFPTLAKVIQSGIPPSQYFDPIRQDIAKTLEITPDSIDFSQPKYAAVLQYHDPQTSQIRPMTDAEAMNWARQQPEWQKTSQASSSAASTVKSLATAFGAAKF